MSALWIVAALWAAPGATEVPAELRAEPDRAGLRLAWAHRLLREGDLEGAEREARRVLSEWPASLRPHMVLAGVAFARGRSAEAAEELRVVEARAPEPLARSARAALARLERRAGAPCVVRGVVGVAYDTRAAPPDATVEEDVGRAATRLRLGAGAECGRAAGGWRLRASGGVDRTAHLGAAGERDRLLALAALRMTRAAGGVETGLRAEARGALGGRVGAVHHGGGGLGAWIGREASVFSPWLEGRALYLRFADRADPEAWVGDVGLGATHHGRRWRAGLRLGVVRVSNEDGWTEVGGDLSAEVLLGPTALVGGAGVASRDELASLRPRARAGLRWRVSDRWSVLGDLRWRSAPGWDRVVSGLTLEGTR